MPLVNRPPRLDLPEEDFLADYDAGMSMNKLADKYKCSRPAVKARLLKAGREIRPNKTGRPKKKKNPVNHEEIAAKIERDREAAEEKKNSNGKPKRRIGW
jgi:hypothetical protein